MVILTANGFQNKENCSDLLKIVKNKKVFICTNAIDRDIYKKKCYEKNFAFLNGLPSRLDGGDLTCENIYKYQDYYDCIFIAEGNIKKLGDSLNNKEVKEGLLKFVSRGKTLICEGLSSLIATQNLDYINAVLNCLDEENDFYKSLNYSSITTLGLTKEKIIVYPNILRGKFQGACKLAEKQNRISFRYLKDDEFIVL